VRRIAIIAAVPRSIVRIFSSWFSSLLKTLLQSFVPQPYSTNGQASWRLENSFRTFPQL
jgi:hypothetical protein